MAVNPVGLNQNAYGTAPVSKTQQQVTPATSQPIPVGQTVQYPQVQNNQNYLLPQNNNVINNLPQSQNSYENDVMMNGIDFNQVAKDIGMVSNGVQNQAGQQPVQTVQPQEVVPQQPQEIAAQQPQTIQPQPEIPSQIDSQQQLQSQVQQPAFTGNSVEPEKGANSGLTNCLVDTGKTANKKSNLGMMIGAGAGFVAPFLCNKFKLGKFLTKDLLLKVPVLTAGGLCAGGIAEGLTASTKKLQANNLSSEVVTPVKMDVKA